MFRILGSGIANDSGSLYSLTRSSCLIRMLVESLVQQQRQNVTFFLTCRDSN